MSRRRLDVLPVMQFLLLLFLPDLLAFELLAFSRPGRRRLETALLLLHAKLQRILLLLAHHLLLMQRPRSRVLRTPNRARQGAKKSKQDD